MRSIFVQAPFGRYDLGGQAGPAWGRPVALAGGRAAYSLIRGDLTAPPDLSGHGALGQIVTDQSDISGLDKLIEDGLKDVPNELVGSFQDKKKQCQDLLDKGGVVGLAAGGKCLYDLYEEIKKAMKHPPAPKAAPPPQAPAAQPFPVVPVIMAVVGGAALVFGITKL